MSDHDTTAKGILWDEPANETLEEGPSDTALWAYVRDLRVAGAYSYTDIAARLGLSPGTVSQVVSCREDGLEEHERFILMREEYEEERRRRLKEARQQVLSRQDLIEFIEYFELERAAVSFKRLKRQGVLCDTTNNVSLRASPCATEGVPDPIVPHTP